MPFVIIAKPLQGDTTKKSFADAIIDNLTFMNGELSGLKSLSVPNGSFELDADSDNIPDGWEWLAYTGGTFTIDTTGGGHAAKAFKITTPGGAGNGGGYLELEDYLEVSPTAQLTVSFQLKCSAANVSVLAEVRWYTGLLAFISSATLYSEAAANPTSYAIRGGMCLPPATARYAKIRLTGGVVSGNAGNIWFDDVRLGETNNIRSQKFNSSGGGFRWVCPTGVNIARVTCWGGGGTGDSGGGRGGGGGGYARSYVPVVPGTIYLLTVGGASGDTTFNATTVIARGGGGGGGAALGGGAGAANVGDIILTGEQGSQAFYGGDCPNGGGGGKDNNPGNEPGGGGGGGGGSGDSAGGRGQIMIEWIG